MNRKKHEMILFIVDGYPEEYDCFNKLAGNPFTQIKILRYHTQKKITWRGWKGLPWSELNKAARLEVMVRYSGNNRTHRPFLMKIEQWIKLLELCILFNKNYSYLIKQRDCFVAVWNGYKFYESAVKQAANQAGCKVIYWEIGLLPGTTTMDDKGINYLNSLSRSPDFYRQLPDTVSELPDKLIARAFNPDKCVIGNRIQLPSNYIFVPFQVNIDTQVLFHSPWIKDMHHLFSILVGVLDKIADENIKIVIKEHPSCLSNYGREHESVELNDRIFFANLNDTQELIHNSEAVITINSTVGIEALLFGKKVISLGQACYNLLGITQTASSAEELIERIDSLPNWNIDDELRRKFLSFVYNNYSIPCAYNETNAKHWQKVNDRLYKIMNDVPWL